MGKMIDIFREFQGIVIAVREVAPELIPALGIIDPGPARDDVVAIAGLVEKPTVAEAPSNLAIVGRYVLTPEIFDALENTTSGGRRRDSTNGCDQQAAVHTNGIRLSVPGGALRCRQAPRPAEGVDLCSATQATILPMT